MNKKNITLILRFVVFALFVFSAIAKMYPLWAFEKQLVDLGLLSWCDAPVFARFLLGLELAIGFAIIQPHFLRKIVVPATIGLLVVFCIHLGIEMVKHGAMNGNCGCFGQLIPMTPLEAFVKNILTIALLIFIYRNVSDREKGKNRISYLMVIWLISTLAVFVAFPFCPCDKAAPVNPVAETFTEEVDTISAALPVDTVMPVMDTTIVRTADSSRQVMQMAVPAGPAKVKSRFADAAVFNGRKVKLDDGKKILCFFAAGCDHCREAAKEIHELSLKPGFPKVYVFFMDEETHLIPEFFKFAGGEFPHRVLDIPQFWTLIGPDGSTPGVFYLWNGNIMKYFVGIDDKAYKRQLLLDALNIKAE